MVQDHNPKQSGLSEASLRWEGSRHSMAPQRRQVDFLMRVSGLWAFMIS